MQSRIEQLNTLLTQWMEIQMQTRLIDVQLQIIVQFFGKFADCKENCD
jgi:hypothetical protein